MDTLVKMQGMPEIVLTTLLKKGYYKTKTEAIRAGVLSLGEKYKVLEELHEQELNLVALKIKHEEQKMKQKNKKLLSEEEVKKKYGLK